jgi:hypothetical protein
MRSSVPALTCGEVYRLLSSLCSTCMLLTAAAGCEAMRARQCCCSSSTAALTAARATGAGCGRCAAGEPRRLPVPGVLLLPLLSCWLLAASPAGFMPLVVRAAPPPAQHAVRYVSQLQFPCSRQQLHSCATLAIWPQPHPASTV